LLVAQSTADCVNGIMDGTFTFTSSGSTVTTYIAQSGGSNSTQVYVSGNYIQLHYGPRVYLANSCPTSFNPTMFYKFNLLGKTLSMTLDLSQISCACNAAVYLVMMPAYGSNNQPDPTKCGDYYCDANQVCGVYCPEIDLVEANAYTLQFTPHDCSPPNGNYYSSCDGGGCGVNSYRQSGNAYAPGGSIIDTNKAFQYNATFLTSGGLLNQILVVLSQEGRLLKLNSPCSTSYLNSLTTAAQQMVLTMSYWGDTASTMSWLDIPPCDYNTNCNTNGVF